MPKDRLKHVLQVAAGGKIAHAELARELAGVLSEWPAELSENARQPFEALLEKSLSQTDETTRDFVAAQLSGHIAPPFFERLFGNAPVKGPVQDTDDEQSLVNLARAGSEQFLFVFANTFRLSPEISHAILRDGSGKSLAVLCKGARARRATYSALAVLASRVRPAGRWEEKLVLYDEVPRESAEVQLATWRREAKTRSASIGAR